MNKISIIVPVWNAARFLSKAVDSILAQQGVEFELLLVNDGSTDHSLDICREYEQKFSETVRVLNLPHFGVSVARNAALDAATGDWIAFSDSDDFVEPFWCRTLLENALQTDAQLSCAALKCDNAVKQDIRQNFPGILSGILDKEQIIRKALYPFFRIDNNDAKGYLVISLFKRDIIEKYHIRFIPGLLTMQDEVFFTRYLPRIDKAVITDKVLYHYISRNDSSTGCFFRSKKLPRYKMEFCWDLITANRLAVYQDFNLQKYFPDIGQELLLTRTLHAILRDTLDPELSFWEKIKRISIARKNALARLKNRGLGSAQKKRKLRFFSRLLNAGVIPLYCFGRLVPYWTK